MQVAFWVLAAGLLMLAIERRRPGRRFPRVRGWWPRALALNLAQAGAVYLGGVAWDGWILDRRPWSADGLGLLPGALLGYLAITLVYYGWHRARHEVPFLWRWFHQVHHSPQRIEIVTSFYKHPFELLANSVLSSAVLYWMVGLGAEAATLTVLITGLAELFYHWNVRTPHALGPFFQRPEMHCVHHEAEAHRYNYSDLPLWDLLFGTYLNPKTFDGRCGFGPDEHRLGAMLVGRDVQAPAAMAMSECIPRLRFGRSGALLLTLGLAQMSAAALGSPQLEGLAAATGASPAPKVFTTARGLETYSSTFLLEWHDAAGLPHTLTLTPSRYASLRGPYMRRNAYGAVVAYGPVLAASEATRPLHRAVARHALCGDAPLLRELGLSPQDVRGARIRVVPKVGTAPVPTLPLVLDGGCPR